jgi:uncharacterized protein YjbI with pentapeptide repeats
MRTIIGMVRKVHYLFKGWLRTAGLAAVLFALVAVTLFAATAAAATPFVSVEAKLERTAQGAVVTGQVSWNAAAARRAPDHMTVGDLRLVAVSDDGHHPTVLRTKTYDRIASAHVESVRLDIARDDLPAIRPGNRLVLTASQHGVVSQGTRTERTYVTVRQLQRFGTPQDRIGRRSCASVEVVPGANLNRCDLVGAFFDRALVSTRAKATRMLLADLTGATMRGADLTGLSVAGGRLNGADAASAVLDNLSLAGAQAIGLLAQKSTSDLRQGAAGANIFDAQLRDANFEGAVLNGVSLYHSRLERVNFHDATWNSVIADTATLRGANLSGLKGTGSTVTFTDLTDADLRRAPFTAQDLFWATLCHTEMPDGRPPGGENRDCRANVDPGPPPAPNPYVAVRATLTRQSGRATINATISWNTSGISFGMSAGDVRAVAIDAVTGVPTTIASVSIPAGLPATTTFSRAITDPALLHALSHGNRVVLTATQHPPLPSRLGDLTRSSYVTVRTLQPGPGRGRVGMLDCSNRVLSPTSPGPSGYDFCDLPGAVLTQAGLSGPMRDVDLTGADLNKAGLSGIHFDGSALGGVVATGSDFNGVSMIAASAPRLTITSSLISGAEVRSTVLDDADFTDSRINDTTFAADSLDRAVFTGATLDKVDLGFARLRKSRLERVDAMASARRDRRTSLFLADLTDANLKDSKWPTDEAGERPWFWATLCHTTMPPGTTVSGDRDCPR